MHANLAAGSTSGASAFAVGAVVMLVGLLSEEVVGTTDLDVWPWILGAGIAVSVGLVRLAQSMRPEVWAVRVLATVADIGAMVYVLVTLSFRAAGAADIALPTQLEGLFVLSALSFLTGIVLASALAAIVLVRTDGVPASAGMLLGGMSLLFLSSLTGLLAVEPPGWLPTVSVALLALLLVALTLRLRTTPEGGEGT
ncbi:hypothetical protein BH23ACT6_BH23ACT6_28210 [soil metagenome]